MKTSSKIVAVILTVVCAVLSLAAQDKLRRIEQPAKFTYSNTPIQVAVKMDGELLQNRETQAGPDWLRRISLDVTNTSGKDINWLLINLVLREPSYGTKATPETVGIIITFELQHSESKIKSLSAGDRITLKPPATLVDYWTKYALEHGMSDIEKVILDVKQVGFTDDSGWRRGRWSRKDPESGRQVFVSENPEHFTLELSTSILLPKVARFFFRKSV